MANIIAFEIQLNGVRRVISSANDLNASLREAERIANNSTFGSRRFSEATIAANRLKAALQQLRNSNKDQRNDLLNLNSTNAKLREASARVIQLRDQFNRLSDDDQLGDVGRKLNKELAEAQSRLRQIQTQLASAGRVGGSLVNQTQVRQSASSITSIIPGAGASGILGPSIGQVGQLIAGAPAIGAASIAATAAINKVVKLNAEVDDLLGRLQKTGSLTRDQAQALLGPLTDLDTRTTIQELLQIGEVLGKLGVDINANTIGAVDKLNVALSDEFEGGAEQVTNTVGKLRQILNEFRGVEASDAFLRLGNALNVLGASGAATAPVIASFASRIGGVSGPLGLTTAQILGTGAALEELGTASERGSSGFNRILARLAAAPEQFASVLGITNEAVKGVNASATSFADLVNKDIFGAFTLVLQRIKELNLGATDFRNTLGELKIKGQGESEVLGKLSQSYELLESRVKLAGDALSNTNSITQEFEIRNNTLQGQLEKLGNTITESFISSGFTDWLRDVVANVNEWAGASNGVQENLAKEVISLNATVAKAIDYNTTSEERIRIIGDLQEQYPEYFANLNQETASNQDLTIALQQANEAYARRAGLLNIQEDFTKAQEKQGKRQAELAKAQVKLFETLGIAALEYERSTGQAFQRTGDSAQDAFILLSKGFTGRVSFFRDLSSDLAAFKESQQDVTSATINARKEQDFFNNTLQVFAKTELDATKASLEKVKSFKEEALAQKSLIIELAKKGKAEEAARENAQLQIKASEALRITSTRDVNFISELADANLAIIGKQAKAIAAEVNRIAADTDARIKGVGRIDLPDKEDKRRSTKASSQAKTERNQAERELTQFNEAVLRLQRQLDDQRLDALSRDSENLREAALEKEERRYQEQITKIKEGEEAVRKAQEEAQKNLRESVIASEKEIETLRKAGVKDERLTEAQTRLKEAQDDEKASIELFEKTKNQLLSKSFAAQQALLVEHKIALKKINIDFDNREAKDAETNRKNAFRQLKLFYDQLANESEKAENGLRRQLLEERRRQQQAALDTFKGQGLIIELDRIDFEFDQQDLQIERQALERQLDELQKMFSEAREFNDLSIEISGVPAFNAEDLDSIADEIEKTQKQITAIEQREADRRVKNAKAETQKKIEEQKKFKDLFLNTLFDIAKEGIDTEFELRKNAAARQEKEALENVEREFEGRLNAVERNAIETERVEKELEDKKLEIAKEAAEKQKKIAVAQAGINGSLAILKAYATLDPISASIAALGIAAITAFQIARIQDQEFYEGGHTGPAKPTQRRDRKGRNIAGIVHTNEYVMPERVLQTKQGRALANEAERLRKGYGLTSNYGSYETGGFTTAISVPDTQANVSVMINLSEEQLFDLATMVARGAESGAYNGVKNGSKDALREEERQTSLQNRLTV